MQSARQIQSRSLNLKALIQQTIAKGSWTNEGGIGTIEIYRGTLVVAQTDAVHRQIATMLAHFQDLEESADVSFWEADHSRERGDEIDDGDFNDDRPAVGGFGGGFGGGGIF